MPSLRTTERLVALWEVLRPFAIGASFLLAVLIDVIAARTLWDSIHIALTVIICVLLFLPLWLGVYLAISFPFNGLIGAAMMTPEEAGTPDWQAEPSRLKVVAGPIRLPSKDASGSGLIARRVETSLAAWTEIWDSGSGHWLPVNAEDIPPLESGTPLTADAAAKLNGGVPREEP